MPTHRVDGKVAVTQAHMCSKSALRTSAMFEVYKSVLCTD